MQQFAGYIPDHDWFFTLGDLLFVDDDAKKVAKGDKTNHGREYTLQIVACVALR